jgi:hypothetical protein
VRRDQNSGLRLLSRVGERHAGLFIVPELADPVTGFPTFVYETWNDPKVGTHFFPLTDHEPKQGEVVVPSDENLEDELAAISILVGIARQAIRMLAEARDEIEKRDILLTQAGYVVDTIEAALTEEKTQ